MNSLIARGKKIRQTISAVMGTFLAALSCAGQSPYELKHSITSPTPGNGFGFSVVISGTRLVAGAFFDDTGAADAGIAYAYDLSSETPTVPMVTLNNPSPAADDRFGGAVAISGALVVVGAHTDDTGGTNAGSAYVYNLGSTTSTVPMVTLNNPSPAAEDGFGSSVAITGTWIVVGAPFDDTGESAAGIAYVYDLSSATPEVPVNTLRNPVPRFAALFGRSVAISGTRVVVGQTGGREGGAYVYDLRSATPGVPVATLYNPGAGSDYYFGKSVAISGTRAVAGEGVNLAGNAYVYDLISPTPTVPVVTLNNPSPAAEDGFGTVAISGTLLVVGANGDDTGETDVGSAYVYNLTSTTPTVPVATLNNPRPAVEDRFGGSVAIDGATVAIGTPGPFPSPPPFVGSVHIFGPASPPTDSDNDGLRDAWELTYWPTISGHGPLDDFDHDGNVELIELAFGLSPTVADPGGLPAPTDEGGYLTVTIAKRPGVIYEVQSAGTLLAAQSDSFSASTTTVLPSNAPTLKVRDNVPISTPGARFLRVKVTAAP